MHARVCAHACWQRQGVSMGLGVHRSCFPSPSVLQYLMLPGLSAYACRLQCSWCSWAMPRLKTRYARLVKAMQVLTSPPHWAMPRASWSCSAWGCVVSSAELLDGDVQMERVQLSSMHLSQLFLRVEATSIPHQPPQPTHTRTGEAPLFSTTNVPSDDDRWRFRCTAQLPGVRPFVPHAHAPPRAFASSDAGSEREAAQAAALLALRALLADGLVACYWPTRLLIAQAQPAEAAAAGKLPRRPPPPPPVPPRPHAQQQQRHGEGAAPGVAAAHADPGSSQASGGAVSVAAAHLAAFSKFFCPLCSVASTGQKAFETHLTSLRHQRRLRQQVRC
jgi:hypothetical protein